MDQQDDLVPEQESRAVSRRAFGRTAVAAGLGVAGTLAVGSGAAHAQTLTDADILNFALNLEYLEAEFYTRFTTGRTIAEMGVGTSGTGQRGATTGGRRLDFGGTLRTILHEIAENERDHVTFLRDALGPSAVAKPAINLDALGPITSINQFLVVARAFEDVGVSAYGGAAKLISNMNTLEAAARIALTEAYHAGNIRLIVAQRAIATQMLDGNDYPPPPTGSKYFTTSKIGLAKIRTPSMVLAIVYARRTSGTSRGGFFPNGVNGTIRSV